MSDQFRTRREVLADFALGSGVMAAALVPAAVAEAHDELDSLDSIENDLSPTRRRWLNRRRKRLNGHEPLSQAGLLDRLAALQSQDDVLSGDDVSLVGSLIDTLFDSASQARASLETWFREAYGSLVAGATATGRRMVEFAKGHADALSGVDWETLRDRVVCALELIIGVAELVALVRRNPVAVLLAVTVAGALALPPADADDIGGCVLCTQE